MKSWATGDLLIKIVPHGTRPAPNWTFLRYDPRMGDIHWWVATGPGSCTTDCGDLAILTPEQARKINERARRITEGISDASR